VGEDHRVRASRVGGPDDGAGVARIADLRKNCNQPRIGRKDARERDVDVAAGGDDALWGNSVGQ
jgi:hypothetical protein